MVGQTLTYLHDCVSTRRHPVAVPEVPMHLDALLADEPLVGGLAPMLGKMHLRTLSVRGFPTSTWPGVLDDLNRLGFAYQRGAREGVARAALPDFDQWRPVRTPRPGSGCPHRGPWSKWQALALQLQVTLQQGVVQRVEKK